MGCIPEDRQLTGAAVGATILSNFIMEGYRSRDFAGRYFINYKKAKQITWDNVKKFTVKTDNIMNDALSLSGGNLQKLIVARELYLKPSVLIAAQPSRGVDIGQRSIFMIRLWNTATRAMLSCWFPMNFLKSWQSATAYWSSIMDVLWGKLIRVRQQRKKSAC